MKKFLAMLLTVVVAVSLLGGCAGAHVHVCPTQPIATAAPTQGTQPTTAGSSDDAVKTGLAVVTNIVDSTDAAADKNGSAVYDVTLVAVTVDDNGVIDSCAIDGIKSTVEFDATGVITTDLTAAPQTKNELGEAYGMKAYAGSAYEWNEQAQALADYAVGKTVEELKTGAVNESGKAADADLASVATIYIGGYVDAIAMAAETATHLGAHRGDKLVLSTLNALDSSVNAEAEKDGTSQLDVNVTALTMNGDTICHEVQTKSTGAVVLMKPAAPGTGIIAGGTVRSIVGLTGVKNLISKSLGSTNKVNVAYAVIEGLRAQVPRSEWETTKTGGKPAGKAAKAEGKSVEATGKTAEATDKVAEAKKAKADAKPATKPAAKSAAKPAAEKSAKKAAKSAAETPAKAAAKKESK